MFESRCRWPAWLAACGVVLVVGVVPFVLQRDSFPLSDYPMFSSPRSSSEAVDTAVGLAADGSSVRLSPQLIAATDEVILAAVTVSKAINTGVADQLCAEIAVRLGATSRSQPVAGGEVRRVEVVTERFDAIRWYDGDRSPQQRTVHASCAVGPAAPVGSTNSTSPAGSTSLTNSTGPVGTPR